MYSKRMITIFEDRYSEVELSGNEVEEVLSLEPLWGKHHLLFRADNKLLMKHYVGFVATKNLQIQTLPKVYQYTSIMDEKQEQKESIALLFRMLFYSGFINVKEIPDAQTVANFDGDILEIFISIFIKRFLALYNRNVHRNYESIVEKSGLIKGKILFNESIKASHGLYHTHVVEYDHFTENTIINQIIKTVITQLLKVTKRKENKFLLKKGLIYLDNVQMIWLTEHTFKKVRFNRLNESYKPIVELAKAFALKRQPGIMKGDPTTLTFLVPVHKLFEQTVFTAIKGHFYRSEGWTVRKEAPQKDLVPNVGYRLKPDITVLNNGQIKVIVDAKYKNPFRDSKVTVREADLYQMVTYAARYNCSQVYLIYPKFKGHHTKENPIAEYHIPVMGDREVKITVVQMNIHEEGLGADELGRIVREGGTWGQE